MCRASQTAGIGSPFPRNRSTSTSTQALSIKRKGGGDTQERANVLRMCSEFSTEQTSGPRQSATKEKEPTDLLKVSMKVEVVLV